MKKILLLMTAFLMLHLFAISQNSIQMNINHKLGDVDFSTSYGTINNIDNDFNVTRLQYYVSEIAITHDGGIVTTIDDLWILADAKFPTQVALGDRDITSVEKISFYIGVDPDHNHLDPASYGPQHPLAPQSPSMHWGWNPGYRFVAIEGFGGSSYDQLYQLHGLGDPNYFQTEIDLNITASDNKVIINLDADYTRSLEDIVVSSGVIVHGDYLEAKQCLENFRDFVFSPADGTTSTVDFSEVDKFSIYPNPSTNGNFNIALEATKDLTYQVSVTDILGKEIMFFDNVNSKSKLDVQLNNNGFYFINLIKDGYPVISKKLLSK